MIRKRRYRTDGQYTNTDTRTGKKTARTQGRVDLTLAAGRVQTLGDTEETGVIRLISLHITSRYCPASIISERLVSR